MLLNHLKERFIKDITMLFPEIKNLGEDSCEKVLSSISLEEPKNREFGDLTTNAAMVLASKVRKKPADLAILIKDKILYKYEEIKDVSVAGPGFLNIKLKDSFIIEKILDVFEKHDSYGSNDLAKGTKIQIEYVSSNPTGNLHIGHGRWGVMGDILSNIYSLNGFDVCREYYVNDYGTQAKIFSECVKSVYLEKFDMKYPYPEEGYPRDTVSNVADILFEKFADTFIKNKKTLEFDDISFSKNAIGIMVSFISDTLKSIGVEFDVWFFESSLYGEGSFEKTLDFLKKRKLTYEKEEALWFKSTAFGDDKDRVIIRKDGNPTYFASDIMYLMNKKERAFEYLLYILGADHHGYISRLKAIASSIGMDSKKVSIVIGQLVRIVEGREVQKMSRRKGKGFTLDDLVSEVGKDAVRYFFSMNSFDTHLDFDISLAKKKSSQNPVFYVQYAFARVGSIIRKAGESRPGNIDADFISSMDDYDSQAFKDFLLRIDRNDFKNSSERNLAWTILLLPDNVRDACKSDAPYFINQYLYRLASEFHYFYKHNKIISKDKVNIKRLLLALAARLVLKKGLAILGVSAPERM
ncbi:MAG: arginine--tRNA ligase [Actinomycetota bacterium]|nr:arginine--tRNA ligase [Actinomycetota bacterium]